MDYCWSECALLFLSSAIVTFVPEGIVLWLWYFARKKWGISSSPFPPYVITGQTHNINIFLKFYSLAFWRRCFKDKLQTHMPKISVHVNEGESHNIFCFGVRSFWYRLHFFFWLRVCQKFLFTAKAKAYFLLKTI